MATVPEQDAHDEPPLGSITGYNGADCRAFARIAGILSAASAGYANVLAVCPVTCPTSTLHPVDSAMVGPAFEIFDGVTHGRALGTRRRGSNAG